MDRNTRKRYELLDRYFRTQQYDIDELLEHVNSALDTAGLMPISPRTLHNDIRAFQDEMNAPLDPDARNGRKRLYCYCDREFSIFKLNELSESDKEILMNAVKLIDQVDGLPGNVSFEKVKMDLCNAVDYRPMDNPVIIPDTNPYLTGLDEWWKVCYDAITARNTLEIKYVDFDSKDFSFDISPYALKEFNSRWYLIAENNEDVGRYFSFPLDRIADIRVGGHSGYIPNPRSITEYYDDVYGISIKPGDEPEDIRFVVLGRQAKYVYSKPIHPGCRMRWQDDGSLEVRMHVVINYELEHRLLDMADSIRILEPKRLVDKHVAMLKTALGRYGG
ncbi:MAG: WYL domain-containing protein [Bacteroidales bacterium]|nr:WYL domain-containing protein [Bacteroidales bacterium]